MSNANDWVLSYNNFMQMAEIERHPFQHRRVVHLFVFGILSLEETSIPHKVSYAQLCGFLAILKLCKPRP